MLKRASHRFVSLVRSIQSTPPSHYLLTYLLTPWCRVLLEQLTGLQLVKKFPTFHGTRRFITALTSVRHLSLSWASPILSIYPHPTSRISILILSTHLRLGLPSVLFPSGFPTKTLYTPLSPIRATCLAHYLRVHFNIMLSSTTQSSKWSVSLRFPHQNRVWTYSVPHTCHMLHPSFSSWFAHPNCVWPENRTRPISTLCEQTADLNL